MGMKDSWVVALACFPFVCTSQLYVELFASAPQVAVSHPYARSRSQVAVGLGGYIDFEIGLPRRVESAIDIHVNRRYGLSGVSDCLSVYGVEYYLFRQVLLGVVHVAGQ